MPFRRPGSRVVQAIGLALALITPCCRVVAQDPNKCDLCSDGSEPDMSLMSADLGWSCTDLNQFTIYLKAGDKECIDLQLIGFQDCGCPTYPPGYCTLCPGGFSDIPDRDLIVPSPQNLTCGKILFVNSDALAGGCGDLEPYRDHCGCPSDAECSFCADGTMPMNMDRVIPYLSKPSETTTCAQQAQRAFSATAEQCQDIIVPPVAVNVQGFCGCQGTFPSSLCSLCPLGMDIANPDLVLPDTGGLTCQEMDEYLSYITDEASCQAIADSSQVCCQPIEECPVCEGVLFNEDKLYEPYGLTCANIGLASDFGHPMSCEDVQTRFPYFCECADAIPACTLCQLGEVPPETDKPIPLLGTTCKEVNDYASIRLTSECAQEMASQSFDSSAYCGCTGFEPPNQCTFCPEGQIVRQINKAPELAGGATCGDLLDFASYVTTYNLCSSVQAFAFECCVDPDSPTEAPSPGPPPDETIAPGTPGTAIPTATDTLAPGTTAAPTATMPAPAESSADVPLARLGTSLVLLLFTLLAPGFLT
ncbi:expressed unknown protein [Seminavis robusta]|uniref:Uncharacterized protein n=1 Tax=Seminavis robusta TaxID=568900 RepID=A0A9N8HI64_9STRA|nr:expressed unknown protein [Seminavis robusta]|eukprot:Sro575_g169310.1 n/a (533) ;mRNA; f:16239-17837